MPMSNEYDIAIIGGGLAGLCLAIQAVSEGYKVILFEKEQYPFHKVCGEYISLESWDFLQGLGLPLRQMQLPLIKKLDISDSTGRIYPFDLPLGGFGISRFTLDNALYHLALEKGISIFCQTKVTDVLFADDVFTVFTSSEKYIAKTVAGTFGKRSNLDIKWKRPFIKQKNNKLNNYIGIKYHIKYPQSNDTIALHNFYNGYCGISNIENHTCCLCYLTTAKNLSDSHNSISKMEQQILWQNPQLKKIFNEAEFLYKEPLTISQISFSKKMQVENHVMLIGDAAGMITPLCGNGMSIAMHGSKLAFNNIHSFLQGHISRSSMENMYTKQWQQKFGNRLRMGRLVQNIFGGNTTTRLFLSFMKGVPFLANQLIKSTHGSTF